MGCNQTKPSRSKANTIVEVGSKPKNSFENFKFVMVGDSGVGKSSIILRCVDGTFTDSFISTIDVDYKEKVVDLNGEKNTLQLWDTAGQERFRTITSSYYRGAQGVIIVFDLTNRKSFDNVRTWIKDVHKFAEEGVYILIGNKLDLERVVTVEEAEELAETYLLNYYETSCKTGEGIEETFQTIAKLSNEFEKRHPRR